MKVSKLLIRFSLCVIANTTTMAAAKLHLQAKLYSFAPNFGPRTVVRSLDHVRFRV